jgi:uncharacterized repeat protein (TIGR01451 family)
VDQSLVYTLSISNNGPATAGNVVVSDQLPAAVSFVSAPSECTEATGLVSCDLGNLDSGIGTEIQITVTADADGTITNTPVAGTDTQDLNTSNDSTAVTTTIDPSADLALTMSGSPDPVHQGGTLTYDIGIENLGPSTATAVTVTYTLPGEASFLSASPECAETAGIVSCTLGNLAQSATSSIQILVTANSTGNLDGTANVSSTVHDPTAGNNSAQTSTQVDPAGSGTVQKIPLPYWALIVLGVLLPILGWLAGLRNRAAREPA